MIVVRRMHHSPAWGLWNHDKGTWYEGRHDDAYYYAGIPTWLTEWQAKAALGRMGKLL